MEKALSNFLSKLNWRLIVVHFAACWLFIYAFELFSYLHDVTFWTTVLNHSRTWLENWKNWNFDASRLTLNLYWLYLSGFVGFLVAFSISLTISIRRHWHWINAIIVFVIICILGKFDLLGWPYLKSIFLAPGSPFSYSSLWYSLINGSVMLTIGLLLFFSRKSVRFVNPATLATTAEDMEN
jgi:hypothetical protein